MSASVGQTRTRLFLAKAVSNARQRAQRRNVAFSLTVEYLATLLPTHCPITGQRLVIYHGFGQGPRDDSPSLDCIVPSRGYVPGNVRWLSSRANRIKSDASLEELEAIVQYVKDSS